MKRFSILLLTALLMISALLAFASCGDKKPSSTTVPPTTTDAPAETFTVTFIVDGESVSVETPVGEMPVYPNGTPYKEATKDSGYRFDGWDSPIVAATEDATYTALFTGVASYPVRWIMPHDVITTYVSDGCVPVYTGSLEIPEGVGETYAFTGWNKELTVITAENASSAVYTALYTTTLKSYTVVFKAGDTILSTQTVEHGTVPTVPTGVPNKDGKKFSSWAPYVAPASGDVTYVALYPNPNADGVHFKLPDAVIESALAQALINYDHNKGQKTNAFNGTTATFLLLVEEHFNPGSEQIVTRVLEQLHSVVTSGNEPDLVLGSEWSPANCASMIALAKHTPTVWSRLSASDVEKLDFLMKLLTYAAAFATNDCNDYRCTLEMIGNYNKEWNPNYRFTNVVPMLAAGQYFGSAAAVDAVLLAFDYDAVLAKCREYNFTNVLDILTIPSKNLLENGGDAFSATGAALGTGKGVKQPYLYKTFSLDESYKILNSLFELNYGGGPVVSSYNDNNGNLVAYIEGNLTSPYEGMVGMYHELGGGDSGGVRSSAGYSMADFNMGTVALMMLVTLEAYDIEEHMPQAMQNKVWVGNNDLLFKLKHGYYSYANGVSTGLTKGGGYAMISSLELVWNEVLDTYVDYVELSKYLLVYTLPDGTTISAGADEATFTLSDRLPAGYVWFDGKKYYNSGASYTCEEAGDFSLTAVKATGVVDGAYKVGSNNNKIMVNSTTATSQSFTKCPTLLSGKILTIITMSSPAGQAPDSFQFMHKHKDAPNPASPLFNCIGGVLYTPDGTKICDYDGSSITLAISYDTAGTVGNIFILKDGAYEFVTTYTYKNNEGTIGRLGYFYMVSSSQSSLETDRRVNYTADYYWGLSHPVDKPVKYPISLTEGGVTTNIFYTTGVETELPAPSNTAGFRGWMNELGEFMTKIPVDSVGVLSLKAVYEGEGFYVNYVVGSETIRYTSETINCPLDGTILPAGHMWFDGKKYYNAGYEYTLSASETLTLTAVPGAGDNGAELIKEANNQSLNLSYGATSDAQHGYQPGGLHEGKFFVEITFRTTSNDLPNHFRLNYKHTTSAHPETCMLRFDNGVFYAWDADLNGTGTNTLVANYTDGIRLGVGYDTLTGLICIYVFDASAETWQLAVSFTAPNAEGTAGRLLYFYMPRNSNPTTEGQTVGIGFDYKMYRGLSAPVSAPTVTPVS